MSRCGELEERHLHSVGRRHILHIRFSRRPHLSVVRLQLLQDRRSPADDGVRHTCYLGHMDTKGVLAASTLQFAEEDHLAIHLLDTHIVVFDAVEAFLHLVELMVVGGKERASLGTLVLVEIFHDGPGYGDTVVGGRAAPQFVEEHERAWRDVVENIGSLGHLHHKR